MKVEERENIHDEEQGATRCPHSISSSLLAFISDTFSVKGMTSQSYCKLGAKPKWAAHADHPSLASGETPLTPIPPWRDRSLWRITTTNTVEGMMSKMVHHGLKTESKRRIEDVYEKLTKKHAMVFARLLKEYEEVKESEKDSNGAGEGKDQE